MKKTVLSSILSIVLCLCLVAGGTFALFTSESKQNIAITSGNIKVVATLEKATDVDWIYTPETIVVPSTGDPIGSGIGANSADVENGVFGGGGTAVVNTNGSVVVNGMVPGDKLNLMVNIQNESTVHMQYRVVVKYLDSEDLTTEITNSSYLAKLNGNTELIGAWTPVRFGETIAPIPLSVELPLTATQKEGDPESVTILVTVEAIQYNVDTAEPGTVTLVSTQTELLTAIEGSFTSNTDTYIRLTKDIAIADLTPDDGDSNKWEDWALVQYTISNDLTIDGNGYTITGLDHPLLPFVQGSNCALTIKNLTISNAEIISDNASWRGVGAFIKSVSDKMSSVVFENCKLTYSTIESDNYAGGFIGHVADHSVRVSVKNCEVNNSTIKADGSSGSIIGHLASSADVVDFYANKNTILYESEEADTKEWRIGILFGTINGNVTENGYTQLNNISVSGNTLYQGENSTNEDAPKQNRPEGQTELIGRITDAAAVKLDGVQIAPVVTPAE